MQFKISFTHKLLISTTILGFGSYYSYKHLYPYFYKSIYNEDNFRSIAVDNYNALLQQNKGPNLDEDFEIKDNLNLDYQNKRYHPTDFIHGLLSSHSYLVSKESDYVKFQDRNKIKYNQYLKDWQVYKVFNPKDSDDYYSVLYVNQHDNQAVLAHRGTDISGSLKLQNESLKADLIEILNHNIGIQQESSYISTQESLKLASEKGWAFSTTGHSLGAWLAELSIYHIHAKNECKDAKHKYKDAKAITFDSPGTYNHFKIYKNSIHNSNTKINEEELDITTYLSAPNIVNTCNEHVGRVYRLFPEISYPEDIVNIIKSKLPETVANKENYVKAFYSVSGHALDPLLECFEPKSGRANKDQVAEVINWPHIKHEENGTETSGYVTGIINLLPIMYLSTVQKLGLHFANSIFSKLIPDNTVNSVFNVIASFVEGKTRLDELFEVYKYLEKAKIGYHLKKDISLSDEFKMYFVAKYKIQEVNLDLSMKIIKNTPEWKLKQLYRWNEGSMRKGLSEKDVNEDTIKRLLDLRKKYKLENETKIKIISQNLFIDDLVDQFRLILYSDKALKDYPNWSDGKYQQEGLHIECEIQSDLIKTIDGFIAKENLSEDIDKILSAKPYVVITGFPGVGKSTYAHQYAELQKNNKQITVLDFASASKESILSKCKEIIDSNNLQINEQDQPNKIIENVFKKISSQTKGTEAILIFDNVENYDEIKEYLEILPKNIKVIITSTDSLDRQNNVLGSDNYIEIQPLNEIESVSYLRSKITEIPRVKIGSQEDKLENKLHQLVKEVSSKGYILPYRLEMVLTGIKEQHGSLIQRINQYTELYKKGGDDKPETSLLFDMLEKSDISWAVLQYALYLDPDSMDKEIFAKLLNIDINTLNESINYLATKSLVKEYITFDSEEIAIHQLTQQGIRQYIKRHESDETVPNIPRQEIIGNLINVLNELVPEITEQVGENLVKINSFYKHANKVLKKIKDVSGIEQDNIKKIAELYKKLGIYNKYITHNYPKELEYYKKSEETYNILSPDITEEKIPLIVNMGWCYFKSDRETSEKCFDKVLDYFGFQRDMSNVDERIKSIPKENLKLIASAISGKGCIFDQKRTVEADSLYLHKAALAIYKSIAVRPDCDKDLAKTLHEVGWYYRSHNDPERALQYFKASYQMRTKLYKNNEIEDHIDLADSLNSIGTSYIKLSSIRDKENNLLKGLEYQTQALDMRERLFGDIETSDKVNSYSRLGETYTALGDNNGVTNIQKNIDLSATDCYGLAIKHFEKMLSTTYKLYNDNNHIHIAGSFQRIAEIYEKLGNILVATEYYKKSYSILLNRNCKFTHQGDKEVQEKIEKYAPDFINSDDLRENVHDTGNFDFDSYKLKIQLQKEVLNNIYELASRGIWSESEKESLGVSDYVSSERLIQILNTEDASILEKAKEMCFEAINLGIMSADKSARNIKCLIEFAKSNPGTIESIKENHPEYFIDSSLLIEAYKHGFISKEELKKHIGSNYDNIQDVIVEQFPDQLNISDLINLDNYHDETDATISPVGDHAVENASSQGWCSIM